MHMNTNGAH